MGRIAPIAGLVALSILSACALMTDLSGLGGGKPEDATSPTAEPPLDDASAPAGDAARGSAPGRYAGYEAPVDAAVEAGAVCTDKRKVGQSCTINADCCSRNCYFDECASNDVGSRCTTDDQCTSNNCYFNECNGNGLGAKCKRDDQCTSNNCYFNECQGNGLGSKCSRNDQCTSKVCKFNECQ